MSDAVDVIKGAFVGALVFFTGGLILGAVGLATPFAGIFGITNTLIASAVGGAITGALNVLLAPSMSMEDVNSRLTISIDPNAMAKWVFGQTALSTDIIFAATHGPDDLYVSHVIASAAHKIQSFESLHINDEGVTWTTEPAEGDWEGGLWIQTRRGFEAQTAIGNIDGDDGFSPTFWPTEAVGAGVAHYRLRWKTDFEKIQNEGGIPNRITMVAKGMPVYDPRADDTNGGTGSHRPQDVTTWQYERGGVDIGANWALVVLSYLLGWRKEPEGEGPLFDTAPLIFGVGVDPSDIDMEQAIAAANVCDTLVDGIPKYRVGGIASLTQDHEQVIKHLEGAINGKVAIVGGKFYIWAPHDDLTPFSSIGEEDLVRDVGVEFNPSTPLEGLFNTARGRYVNPDNLYQPSAYAEIQEDAYVEEDERVRSLEHDFAIIQDQSIAQRVARYIVRRSRFGATWRFAMGPKGLIFRPFTVTTLNIKETNFQDVTVRITDMTISQRGVILMECVEEDESIYDITDPILDAPDSDDPGPLVPGGEGGPRLGTRNIHNTRTIAPCYSGVRLNPNGMLEFMTPTGVWYHPNNLLNQWIGKGNINQDYYARLTHNSGDPLATGVEDAWELLDVSREATIEQPSNGSTTANVTWEIAEDSTGSSIIATGIYDMRAEVITAFLRSVGDPILDPDTSESVDLDIPSGVVGDLLVVMAIGTDYTNISTPNSNWKLERNTQGSRFWTRFATNDTDDDFPLNTASTDNYLVQCARFKATGTFTLDEGFPASASYNTTEDNFRVRAVDAGNDTHNSVVLVGVYKRRFSSGEPPIASLTMGVPSGFELIDSMANVTSELFLAYTGAGWAYQAAPIGNQPAISESEWPSNQSASILTSTTQGCTVRMQYFT